MNEKEGRMRDIDPPPGLDGTGSIRSDALKDVLLHCPGRAAARATLSGEIYLKQWRP